MPPGRETMWLEALFSILVCSSCAAWSKGGIINGQLVTIENRPYMASLRVGDVHVCGGSIISSDVVLTAAHCIEATEKEEEENEKACPHVAVGTMVNYGLAVEFAIRYMAKHANFSADEYVNDIGVLRLCGSIVFSPQIQPIAMASKLPPVGTLAVLSGWGATDNVPGMSHQRKSEAIRLLKTAQVPIVDFDICTDDYIQLVALHQGQVCAGYKIGGADSCPGDSGGPLVYDGQQVGVLSFGDGCGEGGNPGVFTSVPEYHDWIQQFIQ